jgi:hypothetical protein
MGSKVRFEGLGPYHLPAAQEVCATAQLNNGVTITFLLDHRRRQGIECCKRPDQCGRCADAL